MPYSLYRVTKTASAQLAHLRSTGISICMIPVDRRLCVNGSAERRSEVLEHATSIGLIGTMSL
jgi:hypothetical protein